MRLLLILACPYCDSEIGRQVWAGVFNADFGRNVLLTLLPMLVLAAIVLLIHFGAPWPSRPSSDEPEGPTS